MRIALLPRLLALSVIEGLAGCAPAVPAPEASPLRTVPEPWATRQVWEFGCTATVTL